MTPSNSSQKKTWILNEQHEFFTNNWTRYFHPKLSSSIGTRHPMYLTSLTSYIRVSTNYTRMHSSRMRTVRTLPYGGGDRDPSWTETAPWTETDLDRDTPGQRPETPSLDRDRDLPPPVDRQTPVKT